MAEEPATRTFLARHRHKLIALTLVLVSAGLYANALEGEEFIFSSTAAVAGNRAIRDMSNIPRLFVPSSWLGQNMGNARAYRPIQHITHTFEFAAWGADSPRWYRLVNIAVHLVCVVLVYYIGLRLVGPVAALFASALFVVHPIHTEAVVYVTNRDILLMAAFALAAWLPATRWLELAASRGELANGPRPSAWWRVLLALMLFALALLSRESEIMLGPLLAAWVVWCLPRGARRGGLVRTLPFWLGAGGFVLFVVLGPGAHVKQLDWIIPPVDRVALALRTTGYYLGRLCWPVGLIGDHGGTTFTASEKGYELLCTPGVGLSAVVIAAWTGTIVVLHDRKPALSLLLLWVPISLVPAMNIIPINGRPVAEQRLYLPSVGFCLAVGGLLTWGLDSCRRLRWRRSLQIGFVALIALLAVGTVLRNRVWRSKLVFWKDVVTKNPKNVRGRIQMARNLLVAKRLAEAEPHLQEATRLAPKNPRVLAELGKVLIESGKYQEALRRLRKAVSMESGKDAPNPDPLNDLAWLLATSPDESLRDGPEAVRLAKKACELTGNRNGAYVDTLAAAYARTGRFDKALAKAREALALAEKYHMDHFVKEFGERIELFRAGKAYVDKPRPRDPE